MLAPRNDADLVSAAIISRERFQITSGHPLGRMLAQSDVAAPAAPSVEVTHATVVGVVAPVRPWRQRLRQLHPPVQL